MQRKSWRTEREGEEAGPSPVGVLNQDLFTHIVESSREAIGRRNSLFDLSSRRPCTEREKGR